MDREITLGFVPRDPERPTPEVLAGHVKITRSSPPFEEVCGACYGRWPCLVRQLADIHANCTNLTAAEAQRIFDEAKEQRERAERAEALRDSAYVQGGENEWATLAAIYEDDGDQALLAYVKAALERGDWRRGATRGKEG